MKTLQILLDKYHFEACQDAITWLEDRTIEQVMIDIHRGDWLLWLAYKLGVDEKLLTLVMGKWAETCIDLMQNKISTNAVKACIDYGNGLISKENLEAAAYQARKAVASSDRETGANAVAAAAAHIAFHAASKYECDRNYNHDYDYCTTYGSTLTLYDHGARMKNDKQRTDIAKELLGQLIIDKVNELCK